jgi:hypothetical protein
MYLLFLFPHHVIIRGVEHFGSRSSLKKMLLYFIEIKVTVWPD